MHSSVNVTSSVSFVTERLGIMLPESQVPNCYHLTPRVRSTCTNDQLHIYYSCNESDEEEYIM